MVSEISKLNIETQKSAASIAMFTAMISFSMLFLTLFMGYAMYRLRANTWPPMGMDKVELLIPTLSLLVAIISSLFLEQSKKHLQQGSLAKGRRYYIATFLLGLVFVVLQFLFWKELNSNGLYMDSGIFGSLIFGFSWIHVAHIFIGIFALGWFLSTVIGMKRVELLDNIKLGAISSFWHFLGIVWFLIYLFVFLI